MKIRIYETDFDGRPVDCSGEYFSGKTAHGYAEFAIDKGELDTQHPIAASPPAKRI